MNLQSVFSVPKTVLARRVGDEIVVLDLGGGEYFGLPEYGDRDTNFVQFALASAGDYLDAETANKTNSADLSAVR